MISKVDQNVKVPFWMAHYEISSRVNGADWYKKAWEDHTFDGVDLIDHLIDVLPCNSNTWFIQIGAHLGIFPQLSASRSCQSVSVEGNPLHIPVIELTAILNGHQKRHHVVHAAGGSTKGEIFFSKDKAYSNFSDVPFKKDYNRVNLITVDDLVNKYTSISDEINIMIIDVEGYEKEVLSGAHEIISAKKVKFFEIEVWLIKKGVYETDTSQFEFLESQGYKLYIGRAYSMRNTPNYVVPSPIRAKTLKSKKMRKRLCKNSPEWCIIELYAMRADIDAAEIFLW